MGLAGLWSMNANSTEYLSLPFQDVVLDLNSRSGIIEISIIEGVIYHTICYLLYKRKTASGSMVSGD
jgi:hypothetical protein